MASLLRRRPGKRCRLPEPSPPGPGAPRGPQVLESPLDGQIPAFPVFRGPREPLPAPPGSGVPGRSVSGCIDVPKRRPAVAVAALQVDEMVAALVLSSLCCSPGSQAAGDPWRDSGDISDSGSSTSSGHWSGAGSATMSPPHAGSATASPSHCPSSATASPPYPGSATLSPPHAGSATASPPHAGSATASPPPCPCSATASPPHYPGSATASPPHAGSVTVSPPRAGSVTLSPPYPGSATASPPPCAGSATASPPHCPSSATVSPPRAGSATVSPPCCAGSATVSPPCAGSATVSPPHYPGSATASPPPCPSSATASPPHPGSVTASPPHAASATASPPCCAASVTLSPPSDGGFESDAEPAVPEEPQTRRRKGRVRCWCRWPGSGRELRCGVGVRRPLRAGSERGQHSCSCSCFPEEPPPELPPPAVPRAVPGAVPRAVPAVPRAVPSAVPGVPGASGAVSCPVPVVIQPGLSHSAPGSFWHIRADHAYQAVPSIQIPVSPHIFTSISWAAATAPLPSLSPARSRSLTLSDPQPPQPPPLLPPRLLAASPPRASLTPRKIRGEAKKCRKVYGIEHREQWCTACRWKKACQRFLD